MKVAVYYSASDIRMEERTKPRIEDGEILVKMKCCGICGSDLMEWYRVKKAPRILGHEMVGVIVESKVSGYRTGERVFVSHHVPCNNCKYCNEGNHTACETLHRGNFDPGGFSEYIRIPKVNVQFGTYVLPGNVSMDEGTMIEPLACCVRGQRVIDVRPHHIVLIPGSGVSGLLNIQVAKHRGAYVISTDIDDYRLEKAKEFGADEVVNVEKPLDVKADRIIMCTGAQGAFDKMFDYLDRKGRILTFAIPKENMTVPSEIFWRNEYAISSSYGAAPIDLKESLDLISSGKIKVKSMITDHFTLDNILEGWKAASKGGRTLKVLITENS
jgi:L-iditol 2-dehydrogenase